VEEYDQQLLMPLLVVVFKYLNLGNVENLFLLTTIANDSLWGVSSFVEEVYLFLMKSKGSLYRCLPVS
jgi:hypothetical protein